MVVNVPLFVSGTYGNGTTSTLYATDQKRYYDWLYDDAYCVAFRCTHATVDAGTEPVIKFHIKTTSVGASGVTLGAAGTWVLNGAVDITTSAYKIVYDDKIEIEVATAGGTGDAADLSLIATMVMEN